VTTILEEVLGIEGYNTCLIRLSNVGKDAIHHSYKHSILMRVASILDDRDDVGPLLCHVEEVTS